MEKEIIIKKDISEKDLMKDIEFTEDFTKSTIEKINIIENKMVLIMAYLEIKINEEKENLNDDIVKFYKDLKNEIINLYLSKTGSGYHCPKEAKYRISLSFKVSTPKLEYYGINFLNEIDSILTSIVARSSLIRLKKE